MHYLIKNAMIERLADDRAGDEISHCDYCDGSGLITLESEHVFEIWSETCPICHGRGERNLSVEERINSFFQQNQSEEDIIF